MYNLNYNKNLADKTSHYLIKEIMEATPQQLLIKVYDFAIVNCRKQNLIKTNNAIQELINSLSFNGPEVSEISTGLLRLYLYCQEQMRKQNYDIVLKILTELRETWVNALKEQ